MALPSFCNRNTFGEHFGNIKSKFFSKKWEVKLLEKMVVIFWIILRPSDPAYLSKNFNHSISTRYKQGDVNIGRTTRSIFFSIWKNMKCLEVVTIWPPAPSMINILSLPSVFFLKICLEPSFHRLCSTCMEITLNSTC